MCLKCSMVVQSSNLDSLVRSSIVLIVPLYMQIKQAIKLWIAWNVHRIAVRAAA